MRPFRSILLLLSALSSCTYGAAVDSLEATTASPVAPTAGYREKRDYTNNEIDSSVEYSTSKGSGNSGGSIGKGTPERSKKPRYQGKRTLLFF